MNCIIASLYICVNDMKRAIHFYESFFDMPVTEYDETYSVFDINGFRFGLFAYQNMKEEHTYGSNCLPSIGVGNIDILKKKLDGKEICFPLTRIKDNWVAEIVDSEGNHIEITAPANKISYQWTDGNNKDFQLFYQKTEAYYSKIVGGLENRKGFVPYNSSNKIEVVLIAFIDNKAVACAGLKRYSDTDIEIKRVWVEPEYRGQHIAQDMMRKIEDKARESGYKRTILQTREIMKDAVGLYERIGYCRIENYPPYDTLTGAICMAKEL